MSSKRKPKSFSVTARLRPTASGVIPLASPLALLSLMVLTGGCASSPDSESLEWKSVVPGRDTVAYAVESGEPASALPLEDAAVPANGDEGANDPVITRAGAAETGRAMSQTAVAPPSGNAPRSVEPPAEAKPAERHEPEATYEAVEVPPAVTERETPANRAEATADGEVDELEDVERRARPLPAVPMAADSAAPDPMELEEEQFVPDPDEAPTLDEGAPLEVVRDPERERAPETGRGNARSEEAVLPGVEASVVASVDPGPHGTNDRTWNDSVVARVNGAPILFSELKEYALDQNLPLSGLRVDGARGEAFRQAMTARVDQTLLVQAATLEDLTADELEVARRVDSFIAQRIDEAGGRAQFLDRLREAQLSLDSFRSLLIKRETQRQLATGIVQQRVTISSQELETFRKRLEASGEPVEEVQLAQILVPCPPREQETEFGREMFRKALDLATRAGREPAAFSKILAELNNNPAGGARGGLLGWIDPATLQPAIHEAVTGLHPGEVSPPVTTDAGYHVLFLLERRDARDKLYSEKFEEQRNKLVNELRSKAQIEIYPIEGAG